MAMRGTTARIDLVELEKLCVLQCTDKEIASWFSVTTRTIERRRKNPRFREVMERGKAKGRISVRRMQMKLLDEGNATMGVWLGKQLLGQRDRNELMGSLEAPLTLTVRRADMSDASEVCEAPRRALPGLGSRSAAERATE